MDDRGSRLPDDWSPSIEDRDYAAQRGFSEVDIDRIAEDFLGYWTTKTGPQSVHRLWNRVWQRWCRVEADRRPRGNVVRFRSDRDRQGDDYLASLDRMRNGG